jgi:GT2 family glycosyltransferase
LVSTEESRADGVSVDVIVPIHGNYALTRECIQSLIHQTVTPHIVVVDDASPDASRTLVAEEFPRVSLLPLDTNVGFAAACNEGIAYSSGEFVILLNNDVVCSPSMVEDIVRGFADDRVGSVTPIILQPNGLIDAYGITCDRTLAGFLRLAGQPLSRLGSADRYQLLGPYGAVASYRRTALVDVGLLDTNIFMYGEELDLAIRLRQAGWSAAQTDAVAGVHLGGATAQRGSSRQRYLAGFGRGYLSRKHHKALRGARIRLVATEIIVSVVSLLRDRDTASARGRLSGYRRGHASRDPRPLDGIDSTIGFFESLCLRQNKWWRK